MEIEDYDFGGYVTKNDLRCTDGRVIRHNAFANDDGITVPLVWQHLHNDPSMVLGHVRLENRKDGVYGYASFNDSAKAKDAQTAVKHGDVVSMSIYANQLVQHQNNVVHGSIKEVSVVLAGANPGAKIDNICLAHADGTETNLDDEAIIYSGQTIDRTMRHAESDTTPTTVTTATTTPVEIDKGEKTNDNETVGDVLDTFTDKQKKAMMAVVGAIIQDQSEEENDNMSHNAFENDPVSKDDVLCHADEAAIFADIKRYGSLKESTLAHGIENIDYLFPDAKTITPTPEFIKRPTEWVGIVMGLVHHTPFSRIKSVFADITEDEARARGYIKGKLKKEEVFSLLKRTTTPITVYKKQKFEKDDLADIDTMVSVGWIKSEMRTMLDEELARAYLIGDGRLASSEDKINEQNIRPIWTDSELYTTRVNVGVSSSANSDNRARAFIRWVIKSRKQYKGSGNPILFTTEDMLTDCLLLTDTTGRDLYDSPEKLKTRLRVRDIVTVPPMETAIREENNKTLQLLGLLVNLNDYNVGADKGGAVNMFDDFDIDYNAQKYLIETRCSGALIKPYSAVAFECEVETTTGSGSETETVG